MEVIDCEGLVLIPGFVQVHVHLAQTLFRGLAEGLELLDWLSRRVLPLEAAHDPDTLYASARAGIAELLLSGTTCLLDMGTVRHSEAIFQAASEMGIRLVGGKAMMDGAPDAPAPLREDRHDSLKESVRLLERFHQKAGGRLRYAFAPRFLLSCSPELMRESLELAASYDVAWHTHVAEQRAEVRAVREAFGRSSLELLDDWGAADARLCLAHMIHLSPGERDMVSTWRAGVLHCPTSNTKLGSGICKVPAFLAAGVPVGLGADGSPCNNRLDMFLEMRAAAALQNLSVGPGALPSRTLVSMATEKGAEILGLGDEIGTIEAGKRADLAVLDFNRASFVSGADVPDAIVYGSDARTVRYVMVDGRLLVADGRLLLDDEDEIGREAAGAIDILKGRAVNFR